MEGITLKEIGESAKKYSLQDRVAPDDDLIIDPMPNLYFTRDDFTVVGRGVNINSMASVTRRRETLFAHYLFTFHPLYRDVPIWHNRQSPLRLDGGDFLNLTPTTVAIGISQRTVSAAIDLYAKNVFWGGIESPGIEEVFAFLIPDTRAMIPFWSKPSTVTTAFEIGSMFPPII
jgi:arginine deiminase